MRHDAGRLLLSGVLRYDLCATVAGYQDDEARVDLARHRQPLLRLYRPLGET